MSIEDVPHLQAAYDVLRQVSFLQSSSKNLLSCSKFSLPSNSRPLTDSSAQLSSHFYSKKNAFRSFSQSSSSRVSSDNSLIPPLPFACSTFVSENLFEKTLKSDLDDLLSCLDYSSDSWKSLWISYEQDCNISHETATDSKLSPISEHSYFPRIKLLNWLKLSLFLNFPNILEKTIVPWIAEELDNAFSSDIECYSGVFLNNSSSIPHSVSSNIATKMYLSLLAGLGFTAYSALPLLYKILSDSDPELTYRAALTICAVGGHREVRKLLDFAFDERSALVNRSGVIKALDARREFEQTRVRGIPLVFLNNTKYSGTMDNVFLFFPPPSSEESPNLTDYMEHDTNISAPMHLILPMPTSTHRLKKYLWELPLSEQTLVISNNSLSQTDYLILTYMLLSMSSNWLLLHIPSAERKSSKEMKWLNGLLGSVRNLLADQKINVDSFLENDIFNIEHTRQPKFGIHSSYFFALAPFGVYQKVRVIESKPGTFFFDLIRRLIELLYDQTIKCSSLPDKKDYLEYCKILITQWIDRLVLEESILNTIGSLNMVSSILGQWVRPLFDFMIWCFRRAMWGGIKSLEFYKISLLDEKYQVQNRELYAIVKSLWTRLLSKAVQVAGASAIAVGRAVNNAASSSILCYLTEISDLLMDGLNADIWYSNAPFSPFSLSDSKNLMHDCLVAIGIVGWRWKSCSSRLSDTITIKAIQGDMPPEWFTWVLRELGPNGWRWLFWIFQGVVVSPFRTNPSIDSVLGYGEAEEQIISENFHSADKYKNLNEGCNIEIKQWNDNDKLFDNQDVSYVGKANHEDEFQINSKPLNESICSISLRLAAIHCLGEIPQYGFKRNANEVLSDMIDGNTVRPVIIGSLLKYLKSSLDTFHNIFESKLSQYSQKGKYDKLEKIHRYRVVNNKVVQYAWNEWSNRPIVEACIDAICYATRESPTSCSYDKYFMCNNLSFGDCNTTRIENNISRSATRFQLDNKDQKPKEKDFYKFQAQMSIKMKEELLDRHLKKRNFDALVPSNVFDALEIMLQIVGNEVPIDLLELVFSRFCLYGGRMGELLTFHVALGGISIIPFGCVDFGKNSGRLYAMQYQQAAIRVLHLCGVYVIRIILIILAEILGKSDDALEMKDLVYDSLYSFSKFSIRDIIHYFRTDQSPSLRVEVCLLLEYIIPKLNPQDQLHISIFILYDEIKRANFEYY